MKKIISVFVLSAFVLLALTGCLTANASVGSFSTSGKTTEGNMVISVDEFTDTYSVVHKDIGIDFSSGLDSLYFEPTLVYNDSETTIYLRVQYDYFGNSYLVPEKAILLGSDSKIQVNFTADPVYNKIQSATSALGNSLSTEINEPISKEDFETICAFFAENPKIRMGFYLTGNKALELKEYSTRAHSIFADSYAYYSENIKDKADTVSKNKLFVK